MTCAPVHSKITEIEISWASRHQFRCTFAQIEDTHAEDMKSKQWPMLLKLFSIYIEHNLKFWCAWIEQIPVRRDVDNFFEINITVKIFEKQHAYFQYLSPEKTKCGFQNNNGHKYFFNKFFSIVISIYFTEMSPRSARRAVASLSSCAKGCPIEEGASGKKCQCWNGCTKTLALRCYSLSHFW